MSDREADEALAKALADVSDVDPLRWGGADLVARVRAAGWVPLTEVEEALREEAEAMTRSIPATVPERMATFRAADFVASLGADGDHRPACDLPPSHTGGCSVPLGRKP